MSPRLRLASTIAAVGLGLLLRAPALGAGFASDDYVHEAMLDGRYPAPRAPLDLYTFTDGSRADEQALMDAGVLPWWSAPDLRLAMMRPLASALVVVDHALFPANARAAHLHSALWWVLSMLAVSGLLHALLPAPVAVVATLLFALEEGHSMPFGWLANRGALLALAFGAAGLRAHVQWRRDGRVRSAGWSVVAFALALASGEWALPLFGYLVAYELVGSRDPWRLRARALVPAGLLVVAFGALRAVFGYGTRSSGVYVDPLGDPARFVAAAVERVPVFFADLVFAIPSFWWDFGSPWRVALWETGWFGREGAIELPNWHTLHVLLGVVAAVAFVALHRWGTVDASEHERRTHRWLLVGALFSLAPMIGSFSHSRLVLPASIAACATFASVFVRAAQVLRVGRPRLRAVGAALLALGVASVHGYEAGRTSRLDMQTSRRLHEAVARWALAAEVGPDVAGRRVILLTALEHTLAFFTPFVFEHYGRPRPLAFWTLSTAPRPHLLHRASERAIELELRDGAMLETDMERLYRSEELPLRVGERVVLSGLRVEILAAREGRPARVRFEFDAPLDGPDYVVLDSTRDGLRRVKLPAVGEHVELPGPGFPHF